MAATLLLTGCGGGFKLSKLDADRSIVTGSVAPEASAKAVSADSDQATIRNAISSANLDGLGSKPLSWANVETDSRGAITNILERRDAGTVCRRFTASRESFQGVALYKGEACARPDGSWSMRSFEEV